MGTRLSRIYTRTGDGGTTGLGDGSRIDKDNLRVEAIGTVDELNSAIGVLRSNDLNADIDGILERIQHLLFDLGGELAMPGRELISQTDIDELEAHLDRLNSDLPSLREFILPGGNRSAAECHVARGICRRAERCLVSLARQEAISDYLLAYLNRLSDLLFVIARLLARHDGGEVLWHPKQAEE